MISKPGKHTPWSVERAVARLERNSFHPERACAARVLEVGIVHDHDPFDRPVAEVARGYVPYDVWRGSAPALRLYGRDELAKMPLHVRWD